jgi:hypothetical protein
VKIALEFIKLYVNNPCMFHKLLCIRQCDVAVPMYAVTSPIDGTAASEVGTPDVSHIHIDRSRME